VFVRRSGLTLDCGDPAPLWLSALLLYFCTLFGFYPEAKAAQGRRSPKIAVQS